MGEALLPQLGVGQLVVLMELARILVLQTGRRSVVQLGPHIGPPQLQDRGGAEALEQVAAMGFHGLAFDDSHDEDEILHWHEFAAVTWVISGSGSVENEDGKVLDLGPGCRLQAPAGYLHRALAGTNARLVIGTDLPAEKWTSPLNKEPADRPAALSN